MTHLQEEIRIYMSYYPTLWEASFQIYNLYNYVTFQHFILSNFVSKIYVYR